MKTIWKFELALADANVLDMPAGAELLTVQPQGDSVCLWAIVDPSPMSSREVRRVRIYGTGHPIKDDAYSIMRYINTFQLHGGTLIFHAFEVTEKNG